MPYTINPAGENAYIVLKYIGEITRQLAIKATEEAHALGAKQGINRYLVDATEARNVENLLGNYDFAYNDLDGANIDRTACIAMLVSEDDKSHDFVETLLINAGHDVTLFKERDSAVKHLLDVMKFQEKA